MEKQTLGNLMDRKDWEEAVIVFTAESIGTRYTEKERSYEVYRESNFFDGNKDGKALVGNCLDGKDNGVRLENYLDDWDVEYCYITK